MNLMIPNTQTTDTINDDGSVTRVTTTTVTETLTADEYQAEQDSIQAQIDDLQNKLTANQTNLKQVQNNSIKKVLSVNKI